jgi:hypothetical protein
MPLVIAGRIVPLNRSDPDAVFTGRVFIDDSGTVEAVTSGNGAAQCRVQAARSPLRRSGIALIEKRSLRNMPGLWPTPERQSFVP